MYLIADGGISSKNTLVNTKGAISLSINTNYISGISLNVAYTKDEGDDEVTMTDAVKNADQKAEESRQAAKAAYQAKQQARRPRAPRKEVKEEAPAKEAKVETTEESK